jgi:hypothetical protein
MKFDSGMIKTGRILLLVNPLVKPKIAALSRTRPESHQDLAVAKRGSWRNIAITPTTPRLTLRGSMSVNAC